MTGITAGILTGGKSSRMGCDKALLPYRGETFLSHLAGQLDWCDEILISVGRTGGEALAPWGTLVRDELEGFGPVEGIYQLLRRAGSPYVLVAAADMQRLDRTFLRALAAALRPEDRCLVPCWGDLIEPLCAVYHKDALPYLTEMRRAGVHRPRALFSRLPTRYVDLAALGCSPEIMENVNTPADYDALLEQP